VCTSETMVTVQRSPLQSCQPSLRFHNVESAQPGGLDSFPTILKHFLSSAQGLQRWLHHPGALPAPRL
jgi:hypothetical protein